MLRFRDYNNVAPRIGAALAIAVCLLSARQPARAQSKSPLAWTDVQFFDDQHGWACSNRSRVARTADGGKTWETAAVSADGGVTSLEFLDASVGLAAGNDGSILRTTDGGRSWQPAHPPDGRMLCALDVQSGGLGWAVGTGARVLRTIDGGATWNSHSAGVKEKTLTSVLAGSNQRGFITGAGGLLLRTTDGGANWDPLPVETRATLWSVQVAADGWGVCVGNAGVLLESVDGGESWNLVHLEKPADLHDVAITTKYAVAVGSEGAVFVKDRGKPGWRPVDIGQRRELLGVTASPNGDVWVCGTDLQPFRVPCATLERGMRP